MTKRIRSIIALLLAFLMIAPLAACGNADGDSTSTTAAPAVNNDPASTDPVETAPPTHDANGFLLDSLPEDLKLTQKEVTMLHWNAENPEFFVEQANGEVINDAIFSRNQVVEERLGITLKFNEQKGNNSNLANFATYVGNSLMANDYAFDFIGTYSQTAANLAYNKYLMDISRLEYFDFEKPWWPSLLTEEGTVNGKLFFVSGDISTNLLYMMYVTFFNKELLTNYNLEDPYTLVKEGKWTLDRMGEMAVGVYQDLNGDGQKGKEDQYGILVNNLDIDAYFYGSGLRTTDKDADGTLIIAESYFSERSQALNEKLNQLLFVSEDGIYNAGRDVFAEGRALFYSERAVSAIKHFNVEGLSFGILPAPKWEEAQEAHYTCSGNPFTLYAIPLNCRQPDEISAVIECMASEAYRRTTPAIFETSLKVKYSQDEDASLMYDIVRDGVTFDLGRFFGMTMGDLTQTIFRNVVAGGHTNWLTSSKVYTKMLSNYCKKVNDALLAAGE